MILPFNIGQNITYRNQSKIGNATPAQVLSGATFTNASGVGIAGTMANQGAWKNTPTIQGKVTIPAGYHNGNGYIDTTAIYNAGMATSNSPLRFVGNASYSTFNTTIGDMSCTGNILELQLDSLYTILTVNSKKNCNITLVKGLLIITATGSGSSGVYGNGNAHGPSIDFSYDIIVSTE